MANVTETITPSLLRYRRWCEAASAQGLAQELATLREDADEIEDRFCRDLAFGTSGLRGRMGAGTNRINEVVVARATAGVADDLLAASPHPTAVVGYDTRLHSRDYAETTAEVLCDRGVDVYLMEAPHPVPLLSYAVRALGAAGGVMITASHNPREYNGYKVYDGTGCQIDEETARRIEARIRAHDYFEPAPRGERQGRRRPLPPQVPEDYRLHIRQQVRFPSGMEAACRTALSKLSVVYTPLNGTGIAHVPRLLQALGVGRLTLTESQVEGDGLFATCPAPNPEEPRAFRESLATAEALATAGAAPDLILATDPDCDRMGAMVREGDTYVALSGNQTGELLLDYMLACCDAPAGHLLLKSLVSSPLAERMARAHGMDVINTLTGFKNIAKEMERQAAAGRPDAVLFAFEESMGYLCGNYTRDKDGALACQLFCLMAARLKSLGLTPMARLQQLHETYGFMETRTGALRFHRERERAIMEHLMDSLFRAAPETFLGHPLLGQAVERDDTYRAAPVFLGTIRTHAGVEHRIVVRPSGTELKLKVYVFAGGNSRRTAESAGDELLREVLDLLHREKEAFAEV